MKTNKLEKKLNLNKKTILHLTGDKMNVVKGGITKGCISVYPLVCTIGCPASFQLKTECYDCVP